MATTEIITSFSDNELNILVDRISKSIVTDLKTFLIFPEHVNTILTRQQTAELLRISLPTLHDYTKRGMIKAYRLGNKVRYKMDDVNTALKQINTGSK